MIKVLIIKGIIKIKNKYLKVSIIEHFVFIKINNTSNHAKALKAFFAKIIIWNDRRFIEDYSLSVKMVQKKKLCHQFLQRTKYFQEILRLIYPL